MTYLMVFGGLVLLFVGGEALVRGSVSIARKLNISELVIGLTLVGFGTSVPELVTSLRAIGQGAVGIAVGNVVGSNIANILLVLGLAAVIRPILTNPRALTRDGAVMLAVTALLCALIWFDLFTLLAGFGLIGLLLAYLAYSLVADQRRDTDVAVMHAAEGEIVEAQYGLFVGLVIAVIGLVAVIIGARLLVDGGVSIARDFGISEAIIGLTIVAVGTSLPELATTAVAAYRGKSDVAIGNIIGSNIFNVLGILGITALVHPFSVRGNAAAGGIADGPTTSLISPLDISMLVLSTLLLVLFAITGKRITRWEGAVLLLAYAVYFGLLFGLVPVPGILTNG
ncbi:MAG: calcium/sodium antiporter [Alphaproteobacteria bacterium]|nr:calcium/sodium antiporter [Alphaproteobacteria bacterium]MBU2083639.1 calcium/sodium antiporter [Alphaproteobacteria bacterium]MBU2143284.1 calcium/sodium antiporter [Alphaproteobacteria bacterium]MBU2195105.1 calcium/sodium antiporter [Alphaproteobacteria bacterium]